MSQKNIDFGSFPDDPDADAIRTAFQKTQQNFSEIFTGLADQGVSSINKTKQTGITVSSPTGNVLITADFACLTVQSTTLSLQVSNGAIANTQVISNGSQVLQINIPSTANLTNLNLSGNLGVNGWANFGNSTSNVIIANGNISATGAMTVTGNANVGNIGAAAGVFTGAITGSTTLNITGNANVGNLGTAGLIVATGNITGGNLVTSGSLSVTGNANAGNIGATNGVFTNVSGNGSALTSLTGANVTGQVGNALIAGTVYTAAQPNITSVGTLTGLDVNGNITAANITANTGVFTGNGSGLTNLPGSNVSGQVANALVAGTVYTNAQPNITSVGTLTSLSVSGNLSAGNVAGGNLVSANFLQGTLITAAQPNITSVGTLSSLTVTGNVDSGNIQTGNITANANITAGNIYANSGTIGASLLTGTLTTAAQPNITSVGTLSSLSVSGNLSAGNANLGNLAQANFFQGDGSLLTNISVASGTYISNGNSNVSVTANSNVTVSVAGNSAVVVFTGTGANINGYANVTGNLTAGNVSATTVVANLQGGLLTNSQPNITAVGTLSGLTVNGITNLGPNGNVIITGGSANSFLMTNGSGNLSWNTATLVPAQGSNTQIIFNDAGSSYAGNTGFTFDKITGNVAIPGALSVVGNISGNRITGTLVTANQPNIIEVGALGYLIVSGNINAGNLSVPSGTITANMFSGNANSLSNIPGGNVTGQVANALVAGTVYTAAQPNITSVGTLSSLNVTGNITSVSGVFNGNGAGLTNLAAANISGQVANALVAGTVYTAAQPNITSVGTLTSLGVNGNLTAANVIANTGAFYGNGSGLTSLNATQITTGTLAQARLANSSITINGTSIALGASGTITANVSQSLSNGSYITGGSYNGGTAVTWAVDATSTNTADKIVARDANGSFSANIVTANFVGTYANGNSNISIPAANGNINFAVAGRANGAVLFTDSSTVTMIVGNQYPQTSNQNAHYTKIGKDIQLYRGNVLVLDATAAGLTPYVDIYARGTLYVNAAPAGDVTAIETNGNVIIRGLTARKIFNGPANGTIQATAATINSDIVNVTSVTATNRGVVLPDGVYGNNGTTYWGFTITIRNSDSANNLYVYPGFSGGTINGGANNAAYQQAPGTVITYICFSSANSATGTWYTNGATYA